MKICLFVHDLIPEVGHSRALIELINGIEDKSKITHISAVCLKAQDLNILFKDFHCQKSLYLLPGNKIKPFLFKAIWYHLIAYYYSMTKVKDSFKIGIGIASFNVDLSNIQFIHQQWSDKYFEIQKLNIISWVYKRILFFYFHLCEEIFFSNPKRKYIVIAKFMEEFLANHKNINKERILLLPSAVNPEEFSIKYESKDQALEALKKIHKELINVDPKIPTFLFIGAFERKGLHKALNYFSNFPDTQLIIVGRPEKVGKQIQFPKNTFHVPFSKNISLFYEASDCFIFPTYYEPFGLVIIEAYSMGMDLIVPSDNVGASEIIPKDDAIYFFKQNEEIPLINVISLSHEIKKIRHINRLNSLGSITCKNQAQKLLAYLNI